MVLYVNVILYWWEEDGSYNGEYTQPSLYLTVHSCHTGICWQRGSCLPVWAQVRQPFLHFMYPIISKSLYRVFCCKKLNQSILRICLSWQCTSIHLGNTLLLTTQIYLSATYISYTVKLRCIGHSDVKDNFPSPHTKNRWVFQIMREIGFWGQNRLICKCSLYPRFTAFATIYSSWLFPFLQRGDDWILDWSMEHHRLRL